MSLVNIQIKRKLQNTLMGDACFGFAQVVTPNNNNNSAPIQLPILIKSFHRKSMLNRVTYRSPHVPILENPASELRIQAKLTNDSSVNKYIAKLWDVRSSKDGEQIQAIMEYCNQGELFKFVQSNQWKPKIHSKIYFKQLLKAVSALHSRGCAHRDLSLENIMMSSTSSSPVPLSNNNLNSSLTLEENPPELRIIDFGLAVEVPSDQLPTPYCEDKIARGKVHYMSPEMYSQRRYNVFLNDLWSCGVIFFSFLTQRFPYTIPHISDQAFVMICSGKIQQLVIQLLGKENALHPHEIEILSHIFCPEEQRWSIEKLLSHSYFQNKESSNLQISRVNFQAEQKSHFLINDRQSSQSRMLTETQPKQLSY